VRTILPFSSFRPPLHRLGVAATRRGDQTAFLAAGERAWRRSTPQRTSWTRISRPGSPAP